MVFAKSLPACFLILIGVLCPRSVPAGSVWTHLGPPPGIVSDVAVDPAQPSTVYAGTVHGVFKSLDGGSHWFPASTGLPGGSGGFPLRVFSLSVDANAPGTLLAGTENGVFRSIDSASTWAPSSEGMDLLTPEVRDLERDLRQPSVVYALTDPYWYRSVDGGQTWTKLPPPALGAIGAIAIDPTDGPRILAGTFSGVFTSADRGQTWSLLGSPPSEVLYALALDPSDPRTLFAGTTDGVFRSHDGGTSWTKANTNAVVVRFAIDPSGANVIQALDYYGTPIRSTDGGQNWTVARQPSGVNTIALPSGWRPALALDAGDPEVLFASGPTGLLKSTDRGVSWTISDAGISTFWVGSLLAIPGPPGSMLVGSGGGGLGLEHGLLRSDDGGGSWRDSDRGMTTSVIYAMASAPDRSNVIYAGGGGIFQSADGGLSWTTLESGFFSSNPGKTGVIASLAVDPSRTTTLYAGTFAPGKYQPLSASGIFKSTDGGSTWVRSVAGLPEPDMPTIQSIVVDPSQPATVYACTDEGLFKSSDSGATWTRTILTSSRVNVLRLGPANTATLVAGLDEGGIYRSDDGGQTWRPTSSGLPNGAVWDLIFHPSDPAQLFTTVSGVGVFRSRDTGRSWEEFSEGLGDPQIVRLAFDHSSLYLLAGGSDLGVWLRAAPISRELLQRSRNRPSPRSVTRR